MKHFFLIILLALSVTALGQSHKRHGRGTEFDFTAHAGVNLSQIDGDGSGNYDHIGFHGAVNTSFPVGDGGLRMVVELGVSQKGSHVNQINRDIDLLYVEVPLMLAYRMMDGRLQAEVGVAPAILGRAKVTDAGAYNDLQSNNYKRMDMLPFCAGAQYLVGDHFGLNLRFNTSMLNVGIENGTGTYRIFRSNKGQFNRLLSAGVSYRF